MPGIGKPRKTLAFAGPVAAVVSLLAAGETISGSQPTLPEDLPLWSLQPVGDPAPPVLSDGSRARNEIDRFLFFRLEAEGISPAPPAAPETLLRRLYFDLLGRPPRPEETAAFLSDPSPSSWDRLVDRLLGSPQYGEQAARHWLDLVRYAESNGFKSDEYRPLAWRYRDWVVQAFNADMPFDRFVRMQLAGDEMEGDGAQGMVATGYLRLWPYESNQRNASQQLGEILDNITDVSGDVFLGLSLSCARCHDHKFDPILQADYYRFRAFFAGLYPVNDAVAVTEEERQRHQRTQAEWEESTVQLRNEMSEMLDPWLKRMERSAVSKFHPDFQEIYNRPETERTALDEQIRLLMGWQVDMAQGEALSRFSDEERKRYDELRSRLAAFDALKPRALPTAFGVRDVGPEAPPTAIPGKPRAGDVAPGFLSALDPRPAGVTPPPHRSDSSGRRSALAGWIGSPENPLTARVLVNRIWQQHFGEGLVVTPNDFGRQGERPSHPELLDWLARRFIEEGWSMKRLHRLMLTSAAYRQASVIDPGPAAQRADPENRLLWRMRVRRLTGDQIRDAMLAASGELDPAMGGTGAKDDEPRRSIYLRFLRNERPLFSTQFDGPDGFNSCPRRDETTTPTQSLFLMNGEWPLERARALARAVSAGHADPHADEVLDAISQRALARSPSPGERAVFHDFLYGQTRLIRANGAMEEVKARREALVDLCHAVLVSNAFLHVD
ncbi:MAG TPA: DUF1549 and DUF1553 domain-containing protein [Verrucomicrobiales bacterium]|nr:DUF1549 and DUF1553 domain-containing protein [Verrucomicrobiales bacterium]